MSKKVVHIRAPKRRDRVNGIAALIDRDIAELIPVQPMHSISAKKARKSIIRRGVQNTIDKSEIDCVKQKMLELRENVEKKLNDPDIRKYPDKADLNTAQNNYEDAALSMYSTIE